MSDTDSVQTVQQEAHSDPGPAHDKYTENVARFLVPASTVTAIVSEMRALQDMEHEFTMSLFSRSLQEYGVPDEALQNLGNRVYEQSPMQSKLNAIRGTLTTHHKTLNYYKKEFGLVEPV